LERFPTKSWVLILAVCAAVGFVALWLSWHDETPPKATQTELQEALCGPGAADRISEAESARELGVHVGCRVEVWEDGSLSAVADVWSSLDAFGRLVRWTGDDLERVSAIAEGETVILSDGSRIEATPVGSLAIEIQPRETP